MDITLTAPFAADSAVNDFDVRQMKKALNRLGCYTPYEKTGITGIPDNAVFLALKTFQKQNGLPVTGTAKPNDQTMITINRALSRISDKSYIWHTTKDEKVRSAHAALDGDIREWGNSPDPGEDFNCRCWAEPLSNNAMERKKAVLGNGKADFTLKPDLEPVTEEPFYVFPVFSEVKENDKIILEEAKKAKVAPDLVKAIIYVESTQGWYDRITPWNKSIRPMNIQAEYWKELGYSRDDLEIPRLNIRAGIELIHRLQLQAPQATIEEIATLYNDLNAKRISDYGARVAKIMKEKPWEK
jgi:peptidoglycan hydrolase-like protein with peptidoglycan-binding domain